MDLRLDTISDLEGFRALSDIWDGIVQASSRATYFASWTWLFTWWETYSTPDMQLRILCVYRNDRLIAILPLYTGHSRKYNLLGFTWLRFLGTGEDEIEEVSTEYSDIICLDKDEDEVVDFLRRCLITGQIHWDKFVLERVLESSLVVRMLSDTAYGFRRISSLAGNRYFLDVSHGFESCKNGFDASFRKKIEYCFRKIERIGQFEFSLTTDRNRIAEDLETLRELHTRRWRKKGRPGAFTAEKFIRFHRAQMDYLMGRAGLFLLKLSHQDEAVAMLYAIGYKDKFFYYQSGFEPDRFASFSLGHTMIVKSIETAISNRYTFFDFMLGNPHSYKRAYGCKTEAMYNMKVYNRRGRSRLLLKVSMFGARIGSLATAHHDEPRATH